MKVLCLAVLALCAFFNTTAQDNWISFPQNVLYLDGLKPHDVQSINIKLADGLVVSKLKLKVHKPIQLRVDSSPPRDFSEAVKLSVTADTIPSLRVDTDMSLINRTGKYEGIVSFMYEDKKMDLTFFLVRPAAKLESPGKLKVEIVGGKISNKAELVLRETGRLTDIGSIQLVRPFFAEANKDSILMIANDNKRIQAGEVASYKLTVNAAAIDALDFNKYLGKMEVTAPELAAPLFIDVELIKRRHKIVILLVLFCGVLTGFIVRIYFKNQVIIGRLRLRAARAIARAKNELLIIADKDFHGKIKEKITELDQLFASGINQLSVEPSTTTALETALTDFVTFVNTEKKVVFDALQVTATKLTELAPLYEANNLLEFIKEGKPGEKEFNEAKRLLEKKDRQASVHAQVAHGRLETYRNTQLQFLEDCTSYLLSSQGYPVLTENSSLPDPKPVIPGSDEVAILKNDAVENKKLDEKVTTIRSSAITPAIQLVDELFLLLKKMHTRLTKKVSDVFEYNKSIGAIDPKREEEVKTKLIYWAAAVDTSLNKRTETVELSTAAYALQNAWTGALVKPKDNAGGAEMASRDLDDIKVESVPLPSQGVNAPGNTPPITSDIDLLERIFKIEKTIMVNLILQSLFTMGIMAFFSYTLYAPSFIGTWPEMTSMAMFAFSLDVSIDGINAIRDKKV